MLWPMEPDTADRHCKRMISRRAGTAFQIVLAVVAMAGCGGNDAALSDGTGQPPAVSTTSMDGGAARAGGSTELATDARARLDELAAQFKAAIPGLNAGTVQEGEEKDPFNGGKAWMMSMSGEDVEFVLMAVESRRWYDLMTNDPEMVGEVQAYVFGFPFVVQISKDSTDRKVERTAMFAVPGATLKSK